MDIIKIIDHLINEALLLGINLTEIRLDETTLNKFTEELIKNHAHLKNNYKRSMTISQYRGLDICRVREVWEKKIYIEIS